MSHVLSFVGNFGGDPVMRYLPSGTAVVNGSVATNNKYKNAEGEEVNEVIWFRLTWWGKSGEVVNTYFKKGQPIYIVAARLKGTEEGQPKVYQRDDGTWASSFEATVEKWEFISGANGNGQNATSEDKEVIPF